MYCLNFKLVKTQWFHSLVKTVNCLHLLFSYTMPATSQETNPVSHAEEALRLNPNEKMTSWASFNDHSDRNLLIKPTHLMASGFEARLALWAWGQFLGMRDTREQEQEDLCCGHTSGGQTAGCPWTIINFSGYYLFTLWNRMEGRIRLYI